MMDNALARLRAAQEAVATLSVIPQDDSGFEAGDVIRWKHGGSWQCAQKNNWRQWTVNGRDMVYTWDSLTADFTSQPLEAFEVARTWGDGRVAVPPQIAVEATADGMTLQDKAAGNMWVREGDQWVLL